MSEILALLIILMIVGGLFALESNLMLVSIISFGALGFLRSIAFLLLGAPDVAITQIVVEVLSLMVLIRATIGRDIVAAPGHRGIVPMAVAVTLILVIAIAGAGIFQTFPHFGSPSMDRFADAPAAHYLQHGLAETGGANMVTAVILDYRGYDTLGEATILFVSILGAITILRRRARPGAEAPGKEVEA